MNKLDHYRTLLTRHDNQRIISFCDYLIWKFINCDVNDLDPEKIKVLLKVLNERIDISRLRMDKKSIYSLEKVKLEIQFTLEIMKSEIIEKEIS